MDRNALAALHAATTDDTAMDPHVKAALLEALSSGTPLPPDKLMVAVVRVDAGLLDLDFGEIGALRELGDGSYQLTVAGDHGHHRLVFAPTRAQPLALDGHRVPHCAVRGALAGVPVSGTGWYEHGDDSTPYDAGPHRVSIVLDNGYELLAQNVDHARNSLTCWAPDGTVLATQSDLSTSAPWTSLGTLNTYPTRWQLTAPEPDLRLEVTAWFPEQEIRTSVVGRGYLCAAAQVSGLLAGEPVSGWAIAEVVAPQRVHDIAEYVGRLRAVTQHEVHRLYPDQPSTAVTTSLLGGSGTALEGFSDQVVHETLVPPIRHVTDAAGRGWRTYVCSASIELFGVSSAPYTPLMAAAEIIHSANLAIDDIQDGSSWRRGVPAVHVVYGVPTTINAATAAYFVLDRIIGEILPDDDRMRLRVYQVYVRTLRAAHGGQAVDLLGHADLMDQAVATGDPQALLRRIRATHRFKTGVPARGFAEIGATIARADTEQTTALGDYFEAVGTAYQITDDVLDLLGALGRPAEGRRRKHSGEDLSSGKVTMPLAHTVALLPADHMATLWKSIRDGGADQDTARAVATTIAESGAIDLCYQEATALVDNAWNRLEPLLAGSMTKVMVRALGSYAAQRTPQPDEPEVPPCS